MIVKKGYWVTDGFMGNVGVTNIKYSLFETEGEYNEWVDEWNNREEED